MDGKEIYVVVKKDGTGANIIANTFAEVIDQIGDDNIWQITKQFYEQEEKK